MNAYEQRMLKVYYMMIDKPGENCARIERSIAMAGHMAIQGHIGGRLSEAMVNPTRRKKRHWVQGTFLHTEQRSKTSNHPQMSRDHSVARHANDKNCTGRP